MYNGNYCHYSCLSTQPGFHWVSRRLAMGLSSSSLPPPPGRCPKCWFTNEPAAFLKLFAVNLSPPSLSPSPLTPCAASFTLEGACATQSGWIHSDKSTEALDEAMDFLCAPSCRMRTLLLSWKLLILLALTLKLLVRHLLSLSTLRNLYPVWIVLLL